MRGNLSEKEAMKECILIEKSGTYDFLEDVDLVEEHALLVIIHVALSEHLHGTLSTRLSMHAHAHLTKRA